MYQAFILTDVAGAIDDVKKFLAVLTRLRRGFSLQIKDTDRLNAG